MKNFIRISFALIFFFMIPLNTSAIDYKDEIDKIAQENNITDDDILNLTPEKVIDYISRQVAENTAAPMKIFTKTMAAILICAVVQAVDFKSDKGARIIIDTVCTLIVFGLLLEPLNNMSLKLLDTLGRVRNFMTSFIPVYSGISLASGEVLTSAVYSGFFLSGLIFVSDFCTSIILPSLNIYFALVVSNSLSYVIKLKSLCDFYLKSVKWVLKTIVSLICFVLTIQTTISRTSENMIVKTGKALAGTAIPVIGPALQDAVSSVYAGMESIKGFAGVVGLISVLNIFISPLIMLVIYWIITNILFIVSDLFELKAIGDCISGLSFATEIMISVVVLFMILLIFSLTIMLSITKGV